MIINSEEQKDCDFVTFYDQFGKYICLFILTNVVNICIVGQFWSGGEGECVYV